MVDQVFPCQALGIGYQFNLKSQSGNISEFKKTIITTKGKSPVFLFQVDHVYCMM